MTKEELKVVYCMRDGLTYYKDIAKKLGKTDNNMRRMLSVMKSNGYVVAIGKGYYKLSDEVSFDDTGSYIEKSLKPELSCDYGESDEVVLNMLVKMRLIVSVLIDRYYNGKCHFPKNEIYSLNILENVYGQRFSEVMKKKSPEAFVVLPHNNRNDLTDERFTGIIDNFRSIQLGNEISEPIGSVIIDDGSMQLDLLFNKQVNDK